MTEHRSKIVFTPEVSALAEKEYQTREHSVSDPIITPFIIAMKLSGYTPSLNDSGCLLLRQCPDCNHSYSTRYERKNYVYWACPDCHSITEGIFQNGRWTRLPESIMTTDTGYQVRLVRDRIVSDLTQREYFTIDSRGNLNQEEDTAYELGRISSAELLRVQALRADWVKKVTQ
ncbi:hypothetical protein J4Z08_22940 [Citrobacter portucalensis]|uniref:hypothetical protein n=1 Tax=Citrobacter portucalensis TaxID=1639133 RepID=UPI0031409AC7